MFSAGVDVHVFDGLDEAGARALTERLLGLTHALEALPLPTLAVAHGLCLTAASSSRWPATCCGPRRTCSSASWRRSSGSPR